jgi:signal transduction histidine kinase/ActR/RegA family two-component response regulator
MHIMTDGLAAILDAVPMHIAILDEHGIITAVNRAWRRFAGANALDSPNFGVGTDYLVSCDLARGDYFEEAAQVAAGIRSVLVGAIELFELDYPCHSPDEQRWFRVSAMRTEQTSGVNVVVMHVNVTDKKLAELALVESHRQQQALSERLSLKQAKLVAAQAVAKIGSLDVNLLTREMGWSKEMFHILEIEDRIAPTLDTFIALIHPDDVEAVKNAFNQSCYTREICSIGHRIVTSAGTVKFVTERWQTSVDRSGRVVFATGTCQDNTERIALEAKLRQSERLEALGQLTGGVAHDFNNLLTVILGNAETLSAELADRHTLKELADMTMTAAERGAELTGRLLAFARRQGLAAKSVDVNKLTMDMSGLLRRTISEDISLTITHASTQSFALIDPGQLEIAVLNLVINARDAMPQGGHLTLETSFAVIDEQYAAAHEEVSSGNYVTLAISDTGAGMDEKTLQRAFEPFYTTKDVGKGSGLGLSMVYGFIKQSKGHVSIHSELAVGTTVRLYLPIGTEREATKSRSAEQPMPRGSELILVVEDDMLARDFVSAQLRSLGYEVMCAGDGNEAITLLLANGNIQLLFTDIVLPNGIDGHALAETARRFRSDLAILFSSGYAESAIARLARLGEGFVLLSKPYTKRDLADRVRLVLDDAVLGQVANSMAN